MKGFTPYHFFYVYVLRSLSRAKEIYIGSTNDLRKRLQQHNAGEVVSTKRYMPWRLEYYEAFSDEHVARVRESRLKNNGNAMLELKKRIALGSDKKSGKGFTLVEIIVVIAIFSMLVTLGLFMSMDTLRGTIHRSERDIVVSMLEKARSRALANIYQIPWGVCAIAPDYVIFRGTSCTAGLSTNETIPASAANPATFSAPIIFSQLSATTTGGTVTIVQDGRTSTITVNREGTIDW